MGLKHYQQQKTTSNVWYGSNVNKNMVIVQLWGAGGGGGTPGGWSFGAEGGGGGYVYAEIPITQVLGKTLILLVGEGGLVNGSRVSYGGGGQANRTGSDNRYGSNGGGYTGLFLNSVSQANALAIAGGGGGGGSSRAGAGNVGGAGGGSTGQDGVSAYDSKTSYRGQGGTQSAAGAEASSDSANTTAPGGALLGGTCRTNGYGGAGGGGYWGGSAGGYSESNTMGGGGGGSGYLNLSYVLNGQNIQGNLKTPAGIDQIGFPGTSVAYGGNASSAGKNGFARITIGGVVREYNYTGSPIAISIEKSPIVTSGLVLWLDAGDAASYPGSGTTWNDLSGNASNGTLQNGVSYSSSDSGSLVFDGTNDTVSIPSILSSYPFTVSMWVTNNLGWVAGLGTLDELFNMSIAGQRVSMGIVNVSGWPGTITLMYGGTSHWTCPGPVSTGPNDWHNITWVVHGSNNTNHQIYLDGVSQSMTNNGGSHGGTAGWNIGSNSAGGEHWNGKISSTFVYNRILSSSEIVQNYNALRSRFGL